jgi:enoyl-[acyl-carrier protein] reductase / trans-2-enoyl-CoA reductase (NAD+)
VSLQVVQPRIRGFIATNAHPDGCAVNVQELWAHARTTSTGGKLDNVLVIGSSTGYGLATTLCTNFSSGGKALGVCLERPSTEERTGSAGWYNVVEATRIAQEEYRTLRTINGDCFSDEVKQAVVQELKRNFGKLNFVAYSIAAPRRRDPETGTVYNSVLKPVGVPYTGKTIDLRTDQVLDNAIEPATEDEIRDTVKVMGGEDWARWVRLLLDEDLLDKQCYAVAYTYIGPQITWPIYRGGTIGKAKEHLEATAFQLNPLMQKAVEGGAYVSANKSTITQASAAIPAVPLYMSVLRKVLHEKRLEETTIAQIARMVHDHFSTFKPWPAPAADGMIHLDDWEMREDVQAEVAERFTKITTETLNILGDYDGYKQEFARLFGFGVPGVDYSQPTEIHRTNKDIIDMSGER